MEQNTTMSEIDIEQFLKGMQLLHGFPKDTDSLTTEDIFSLYSRCPSEITAYLVQVHKEIGFSTLYTKQGLIQRYHLSNYMRHTLDEYAALHQYVRLGGKRYFFRLK